MKPQLSITEVLSWCDAFHAARGRWPRQDDGPVRFANLTWSALNQALKRGYRGLPGGHTLAELLRDHRGVRHKKYLPRLSVAQILRWADAHHARTGDWPGHDSGAIPDTNGETWVAMETALRVGSRGLRGNSSLAQLLDARRGVRNHRALAPLTHAQVLAWADAHHAHTGSWPAPSSGPIAGTAGETWHAVGAALLMGHRGLPRGDSLARLLAEHRGVRHHIEVPPLSVEQILAWADAHHARTGQWPFGTGGPIEGAPGETWHGVDSALYAGARGLPGNDSLARFLGRHRGKRNPSALPPLAPEQIREWVRAHRQQTGRWPVATAGAIAAAPGETWCGVSKALARGRRGLPGGITLAQIVKQCAAET